MGQDDILKGGLSCEFRDAQENRMHITTAILIISFSAANPNHLHHIHHRHHDHDHDHHHHCHHDHHQPGECARCFVGDRCGEGGSR